MIIPRRAGGSLGLVSATIAAVFVWYILRPTFLERSTSSLAPSPIPPLPAVPSPNATDALSQKEREYFDPLNFVNGPGTKSLRDNLRKDMNYVTAFVEAGLTNEFMSDANLIYLGLLSERVPIVPPHSSMHIGTPEEVGVLHFGDVWDLEGLRKRINYPVLDWIDVKDFFAGDARLDVLGCWSIWMAWHDNPRGSSVHSALLTDISYTPVPDHTKLENLHNSFSAIAALGFPSGRDEGLRKVYEAHHRPIQVPSSRTKSSLPPDDHLMCLDTGYYLASVTAYEWDKDYNFVWRLVGRHIRWNKRITDMAYRYLERLWGLKAGDVFPEYIAVHVRHNDFGDYCNGGPLETCFTPISVIASHVENIQRELDLRSSHTPSSESSLPAMRVLITSDEVDPAWWADIERRGWSYFDWSSPEWVILEDPQYRIHEAWWPTLIDAACQSMAAGFVGTEGSTMSLLALKRVREWNGGVGVLIPQGPGLYSEESKEESKHDNGAVSFQ